MALKDRLPDETKSRVRNILLDIRVRAVELQETSGEIEGLLSIFLDGLASRIINLIDIALGEL